MFFAVSVWENNAQMGAFAKGGLHGKLTQVAMDEMAMFYNHSEAFDGVPSRDEMVAAWNAGIAERDGRGTVGSYNRH